MTDLIEVQARTLAGAALDWAVAQVEGIEVAIAEPHYGTDWRVYRPKSGEKYSPSTDWAVGGPLVAKYRLDITMERRDLIWAYVTDIDGRPVIINEVHGAFGTTHLIAACRAIVAAKLGETVQVPKELIQ